jgi:molecular chaperone DnaK
VVVLVIAAVVAVLVLVVNRSGPGDDPGGTSAPTTQAVIPGPPAVGTVTLGGGQLVVPPPGGDQMAAVTGLGNGNLVAVGYSVNRQPRAWVYPGKGEMVAATVPVDGQGQILDVAKLGSTVVAVGWTGVGATSRAAVWTSPDGSNWTLQPPGSDFTPTSGIKQLTAVTTTADNRLLAIARDDRVDRAEGDGAVYTSNDGRAWQAVQSTGLSGSGPQDVVRLTRSGSSLVALGSILQGAKRGPAIWTSADGVKWDSSPYVPEGTPSLQGIATRADGKLMACGTIGAGDPPTTGCWTQTADQRWERWDVTSDAGSPRPLLLYGLYAAGQSVVVVGLGQPKDGKGNDAAMWTVTFGPRR